MLFHFFQYLIYGVFNETFVKMFMEKPSFSVQISKKPVLRCSMLQKIKMPNFAILKWRPFEYKVKSRKLGPFLECFFRKKKCRHFEFFLNQIFRYLFLISHEMTYMGLLFLKLRATELDSRTERRLLIAN